MPYKIVEKLAKLEPYEPIKGNYSVRLDANESFINLNDDIKAQIASAVAEVDFNRYPESTAETARKAFAEFYGVNSDNVVAGNGSDEIISIITSTMLEKGDIILTLAPDFSMYHFYGDIYEADVRVIKKEDDLTISVDAILDTAKQIGAKAVVFSNPCNPTSLILSRSEVLRLVSSTDMLVIIDEAYMDFGDMSVMDAVNEFDNLIVLRTCSKAVGIAAVRLGFAVSNRRIAKALTAAKSPYNVNSITQQIGATVLQNKQYLKDCIAQIIESRNELYKEICAIAENSSKIIKVYKPETNFVFVKLDGAEQVHKALLEKGIAVRCFKDYLRISAGSKSENSALIKALKEIL